MPSSVSKGESLSRRKKIQAGYELPFQQSCANLSPLLLLGNVVRMIRASGISQFFRREIRRP